MITLFIISGPEVLSKIVQGSGTLINVKQIWREYGEACVIPCCVLYIMDLESTVKKRARAFVMKCYRKHG